jgi:hypothetical protein
MCVDCNKKKINGCWECPPPVSVAILTFEKWDENSEEPVTGILQLDHTILETGDYILQLQLNYWPQGIDNYYSLSDVHINGSIDVGNANERQVEMSLVNDPTSKFTFTHTAKVSASKGDTVGFILTNFKYIDNGSIVVTKLP